MYSFIVKVRGDEAVPPVLQEVREHLEKQAPPDSRVTLVVPVLVDTQDPADLMAIREPREHMAALEHQVWP